MIPYGRQVVSREDIDAVIKVLQSDYLTQGPEVQEFENEVASCCSANHAVAVNSATSALHLACMSLGVGLGDIVWTSPNTFVASANCARYCGAEVDFVDIDPDTWNMCPRRLAEKLAIADKQNRLPKVVIPVHLCGQSCDMAAVHALAQQYQFRVIEDASHAIGGQYQNQPVGNCRYSDITVFSFHPVKIITTAEGGMALTNISTLAERMKRLRVHGITREPERMQNLPSGPWCYEQLELGYNYRMTDIQAALGRSQLKRLSEFVRRRSEIASRDDELLGNMPVKRPKLIKDAHSSWHLYPIRLLLGQIKKSHVQVFEALHKAGIGVNLHYMPVHLHPYYRALGFEAGMFPVAETYSEDAISLPIYPALTVEQQKIVVEALGMALKS